MRECTAFAQHNDIQIVDEYIDRAFSAKTDNRPSFQKMIRDSAKNQFDVIIVRIYPTHLDHNRATKMV